MSYFQLHPNQCIQDSYVHSKVVSKYHTYKILLFGVKIIREKLAMLRQKTDLGLLKKSGEWKGVKGRTCGSDEGLMLKGRKLILRQV